jgi:hypothetical protein
VLECTVQHVATDESLELGRGSLGDDAPASMTLIVAEVVASSRYCVVSTIVVPRSSAR